MLTRAIRAHLVASFVSFVSVTSLAFATASCSGDDTSSGGNDASTSTDATTDTSTGHDAGTDTSVADAQVDAPVDAPAEAAPGVDAGSASCGDAGADAGDAGVACNCVNELGSMITATYDLNGTPPTLGGGTIMDGVYVASSQTVYGASTPDAGATTLEATFLISGGGTQLAEVFATGTAATKVYANFTISTNAADAGDAGAVATLTRTCPGTATISGHYEATPTKLTLGNVFGNETIITVYTRL